MLRRSNPEFSFVRLCGSLGNRGVGSMDRKTGNIVIVRRKNVVAAGHHGGAWKVAYADFVTAMMAFFLLMWLLSTTDQETRLGLADYFSPTIPIHESRSGGDGPFDGDSMFSQDVLSRDETGQKGDPEKMDVPGTPDESLFEVEQELLGGSGDAMEADPLLQHIRTRVTDEGLIIEVFDIDGLAALRRAHGRAGTDLRGARADDRPRAVAHRQSGRGHRAPGGRRHRPRRA